MNRAIHNGAIPRTRVDLAELARLRIVRDVPYADRSARTVLDVYRDRNAVSPEPVLLFVHGGGWDHGDKKSCAPYAIHFALRGYICVSMNYRLAPEDPYPAAVDDVRAAVRWIAEHGGDFGADPNRLALAGQSAGAYLAMLAAYDSQGSPCAPKCIVEFYGPVDLTAPAARRMKPVRRFLGANYRQRPDLYSRASPLAHVSSGCPATLIIHGRADAVVPVRQAEMLAAALNRAHVPHTIVELDGWGHAMDRAEPVFAYCVDAMYPFLRRYLR